VKAAVYRGIGKIVLEEIDIPTLVENTALLRVEAVGICGTDLKAYRRGHPFFQPPCILGHEVVGTVVKVAEPDNSDLVGRTFAIPPYLGCGNCELCRKGLSELCENKIWIGGAFVEYLVAPVVLIRKTMCELHPGMNKSVATLTEPLACAIHGVERMKPKETERVLVIGSGPIGLLISMILRNMSCDPVIYELNVDRLTFAREMGFEAIDAKEIALSEIASMTGKFDHVIVATDSASVIPEAFCCVKPGAKIELFGGMSRSTRLQLDPYHIHYEEVSLIGSFGFSARDFRTAFEELQIHSEIYSRVITAEYTLDEIVKAFGSAMESRNLKVVVKAI